MDDVIGDAVPLTLAESGDVVRERWRSGYEAAVFDMLHQGLAHAVDLLRFHARWGAGREWRGGYCDAILTGVQARMDDLGWLAHETLEWPAEILKRMQDDIA